MLPKLNGVSDSSVSAPSARIPLGRARLALALSRVAPFLLLSGVLFSLAAVGCEAVQERVSPSTPTSKAATPTAPLGTQATPAGSAVSPSATYTQPGNTAAQSDLVLSVSIASHPPGMAEYDRRTWQHWTDEDKDCQNARQEVLIAESTVAVTYQSEDECRVSSGLWQGPYTGKIVDDPGALDVDHMVPLENAHRSGAWGWDKERKREFANYLGYDNHLIATTSGANRSKGSRGPEEWRPPLQDYWCLYATDWVAIKNEWGLTVTHPEYVALLEMLASCETTVLLESQGEASPARPTPSIPPTRPTPAISPSLPTDLRYDPFGPDRDCGEFDAYEEALAFFLAAGGPEADPHKLDVNGDGEPCEGLPGGPSAKESPAPPGGSTALSQGPGPLPAAHHPGCAATGSPDSADSYLTAALSGNSPGLDCISTLAPIATVAQLPATTLSPTTAPSPTPAPPPAPAPTPVPTSPLRNPVPEVGCSSFSDWKEAQDFFLSKGGPVDDQYGLDGNRDGIACQSLPGAPAVAAELPATPTPTPTVVPEPTPVSPAYVGLPFEPAGPDRNCGDFASWWDAQNFYLAAGGPYIDPHGLDRNGDGTACESLVGAPKDDPAPLAPQYEPTPDHDSFEDRNCSDFSTWREAQDFFESEGGPEKDPHRLDGNKDGEACESLTGAPK